MPDSPLYGSARSGPRPTPLAARPANAHQARLLRLLRDNGPVSRAELGEAVQLSRSKLAVELDRLTEIGLVEEAGLAASRGGRRSAIVRLASGLRFLGIDIGATSVDVAVTNGELRCSARSARPWTSGRALTWSWRSCSISSASCGPREGRWSSTAPASACPARCPSATACPSLRRSCPGGTSSRSAPCCRSTSGARCCSTTT